MTLSSNKFKLLVEAGAWNAPSNEEEKIIALQSQINKLQAKKPPQYAPATTHRGSTNRKDSSTKKTFEKDPHQPKWLLDHIKPYKLTTVMEYKKKDWLWCSPETGG